MDPYAPVESPESSKLKRSTLSSLAIIFLCCLVLSGFCYLAFEPLTSSIAKRVPMSYEKKFADNLFLSQLKSKSCSNAQAEKVVEKIAYRLVPKHSKMFTFHILDQKEANAFTIPGHNIIFHTGLFAEASGADEIAGIMAHEMQHSLQRHVTQRLVRKGVLSMGSLFALGDVSGLMLVNSLGQEALTLSFDRDDETAADRGAIKMLDRAKVGRIGFAKFFQRLIDKYGKDEKLSLMLSTHPGSEERLKMILKDEQKFSADPILSKKEWLALKKITCAKPKIEKSKKKK